MDNGSETLLADFDREMAITRLLIERVPESSFDWRPHPKSFSLGELATHMATLPHWGAQILGSRSYDVTTATRQQGGLPTLGAVLDAFDSHVAEAHRTFGERSLAEMEEGWLLTRGGHVMMCMPRHAAFRRLLLHHLIHHRGQLTVYLRLLDVSLPSIYGPTADEP